MEIRVAIRVSDEKDHKHLATALRLANQRSNVRLVESPLAEADIVILRRGEAGSAPLLRAAEAGGHPLPVIYTANTGERHPWVLRWPARTTDLIPLAESLYFQVQANHRTRQPAVAAAGNPH